MGWLGIVVASWSYDDDAEINPYGLTAWLSVSCIVVAWFTIDGGAAAFTGPSADHGYAGMYFAMTEVLIAMEVYTGSGDKNPLTLNRIVATLVGILMAVLVAVTPPFVKGGDPKHSLACWTSMKDSFVDLLMKVLSEDDCSKLSDESYKSSFLQDAMEKRADAMYSVKDAARFKILPFGRVDDRLEPLIEDLYITESLLRGLFMFAVDLIADQKAAMLREGNDLQEILSHCNDHETAPTGSEPGKEETAPDEIACKHTGPSGATADLTEDELHYHRTMLFLSISRAVDHQLQTAKAGLDEIRST
jgi:hypothetical protein